MRVYPLARLASKFPRYAALLADTNRTCILVIAHGAVSEDDVITKAHQTSARISFIEDASLLEPYGGVAGTLRYRIQG